MLEGFDTNGRGWCIENLLVCFLVFSSGAYMLLKWPAVNWQGWESIRIWVPIIATRWSVPLNNVLIMASHRACVSQLYVFQVLDLKDIIGKLLLSIVEENHEGRVSILKVFSGPLSEGPLCKHALTLSWSLSLGKDEYVHPTVYYLQAFRGNLLNLF